MGPTGEQPAPSDDAVAFHRWAFDRMDAWSALEVAARCAEVWGDADSSPEMKLAAAFWLVGPGSGPAPQEVIELLGQVDAVPAELSAGVRSELAAAVLQAGDPQLAQELAAEASAILAEASGEVDGPEPRQVAAITRNIVEVLAPLGDRDGTERALATLRRAVEASGEDADGPVSVLAGLIDLGMADRALAAATGASTAAGDSDGDVDAAVEQMRRAAGTLDAVAAKAISVSAGPMVVHAHMEVAQRHLTTGDAASAARTLDRVAPAIPPDPGAAALRVRLNLMLADAIEATEGVEAAMEPQRVAVAAAQQLGAPHVEGWARRGLGQQLAAAGRPAAAVEELAAASDLLAADGDPIELWSVRLSWARAELATGAFAEAADRAEAVLEELAGAAGRDRLAAAESAGDGARAARDLTELAISGRDVAAEGSWSAGEPQRSETHLNALADLQASLGRPSVLARSNAARAAARADDFERAEVHLTRTFEELEGLDVPDRGRVTAVLLWRRAEVRWAADRNDEAIADATEGHSIAEELGDETLAAQILAMAARARHDAWRIAEQSGEGAGEAARLAEDTLIHAIQLAYGIDDDRLAEELGTRLDQIREPG